MFNWLFGNNGDKENNTVVKALRSKGTTKIVVPVTVGDIKSGTVVDSHGYKNEVVLFLRKNKKDR